MLPFVPNHNPLWDAPRIHGELMKLGGDDFAVLAGTAGFGAAYRR